VAESKTTQSGLFGVSMCKATANQLTKMVARLLLVGWNRESGEAAGE
jgi:hypothetical protein